MRDSIPARPLAAAVLAALLAACTAGPDHVRPVFEPDGAFVRGDAIAGTAQAQPGDAGFWRSFDDPQLTALVEETLRANHDLRLALSRLDAANALQRGAKPDRLPTLTASAATSESRQPGDATSSRSHEASIHLGWELDLFGRVRRNLEATRADTDALAADLQALQVSLVADVAVQYLELRGSQQRLVVTRRQAESQADTLRLVEAGLGAGRGTEFDRARVRAQLEATRSRLPALEAQVAFAQHRLAVLTGRPPGALVDQLDEARPLPALPPSLDPGTPGELLRRRPDIAAAEARLHASTARIGVATADLFPRFTLGGLLGSQAGDAGALFGGDSESRFVALGIDWSFLDVGRVRARIAAADANAQGELAVYEQAVLRALEDTENALVRHGKARVEDQHLARAAQDSAAASALARTRHGAGVGTLLEVLDAERADLQAQDELVRSRTRTLASRVELYRALAGGWPTHLPLRKGLAEAAQ